MTCKINTENSMLNFDTNYRLSELDFDVVTKYTYKNTRIENRFYYIEILRNGKESWKTT